MLHGSRDLFVSRQLNFPEGFHTNCSLNIVLPSVTLRDIDPSFQRGNCSRSIHRILQQLHGFSAIHIFHRTDLQRWLFVKYDLSCEKNCEVSFAFSISTQRFFRCARAVMYPDTSEVTWNRFYVEI